MAKRRIRARVISKRREIGASTRPPFETTRIELKNSVDDFFEIKPTSKGLVLFAVQGDAWALTPEIADQLIAGLMKARDQAGRAPEIEVCTRKHLCPAVSHDPSCPVAIAP